MRDLLHYLISQRERVVTKDDLIQHVWHGRIVSDSTLSSRITTLRKAIGDSGEQQRLIRTIARKGIRFIGQVTSDVLPAQASDSLQAGTDSPIATQPVTDKPSIAVLPFDNMSSDRELGFFADGIAEDIITALASYPSFFVIARNSSFSFRTQSLDVKTIGRELGVRYVLEGSLRLAGDRIRATAQLIEAHTGHHVWAGRYDMHRTSTNIFEIQDQITQATTIALAPAIATAERNRAVRKPPVSLDAWGAYQSGMWHLGNSGAEGNALARKFFSLAIELDPLFSGGYVGLSAVLSRAKGTQVKEEELARRAVTLDGADSEAHARLGLALLAGGDHSGAIATAELFIGAVSQSRGGIWGTGRGARLRRASARGACGPASLHPAGSARALPCESIDPSCLDPFFLQRLPGSGSGGHAGNQILSRVWFALPMARCRFGHAGSYRGSSRGATNRCSNLTCRDRFSGA